MNTNSLPKFSSLATAKQFRDSCIHGCWLIILGDDDKFWLCSGREASRLIKLGYENAE